MKVVANDLKYVIGHGATYSAATDNAIAGLPTGAVVVGCFDLAAYEETELVPQDFAVTGQFGTVGSGDVNLVINSVSFTGDLSFTGTFMASSSGGNTVTGLLTSGNFTIEMKNSDGDVIGEGGGTYDDDVDQSVLEASIVVDEEVTTTVPFGVKLYYSGTQRMNDALNVKEVSPVREVCLKQK